MLLFLENCQIFPEELKSVLLPHIYFLNLAKKWIIIFLIASRNLNNFLKKFKFVRIFFNELFKISLFFVRDCQIFPYNWNNLNNNKINIFSEIVQKNHQVFFFKVIENLIKFKYIYIYLIYLNLSCKWTTNYGLSSAYIRI